MSENLYSKILSVNSEVYNPDYYQLLLIQSDNLTPELIEKQYKTQMSKVQNVRSTKYKDFVEFLKGELKQARRILNDPKLRERYDERRKKESSEKLSDIVEMFIQISGNLSEIEIREIHRQGNHLNLLRREIDKIIDENLHALGCKRMRATPEQLKRASDILNRRANKGIVSESQLLYLTENGYSTQKPENSNSEKSKDSDIKKVEQLKKDAHQLNQLADRKKKFKPLFVTLKVLNLIINFVGWILVVGLIGIIFFMKNDPNVVDGVHTVFGIEPVTIVKKVKIPVQVGEIKKEKSDFDKFKETFANPNLDEDFKTHMARARIQIKDIYRKFKKEEKNDLCEQVLNFYYKIIAPNYYNTQTHWEWLMSLEPIDFSRYVDFYGDNFAEFSADDSDLHIPFGGSFMSGNIEIEGSITDSNCDFGFDLQCDSPKDHIRLRVYNDEKGAYFVESAPVSPENKNDKTIRSNKIDTKFPLVNFNLQLDARTSMNKDNGNAIQLKYTLLTTDINGKKIRTPLYYEISSVGKENSRISLYIGRDSKVRIRRISVEPYN